jgi:ElaB/YqjD/DUF883 family membrane-anchored ribosome-binding protein
MGETMTGDEEKRNIESELEKFVRDNLETLEELIRREKESAEETFNKGKDKVRDRVDRTKQEAKSSAKQTFDAFTDPKVQGHFMNAGFEFVMGINSLIRSMPRPPFMRDEDDYRNEYEYRREYERRPPEDDYREAEQRPTPKSIKIRTPEDNGD